MSTNLTNTRPTAIWQPCAAMSGAGLSVNGLGSPRYNPISGAESTHKQLVESFGFSDSRQVQF